MKPIFVPHSSYQSFVIKSLRQHYSGGILVLRNRDWPVICKLFIADLSHATALLRDSYDDKGPEPRDPASMLRSYLLFLLTSPEIGITKWVDRMYSIPLYAILSGFEPGDIPGVGTFYDFLSRFWSADENNIKPRKKPKKRKPKKGKKGEKSPISKPGRVDRLVRWMLPRLDQKLEQPTDRLFTFFESQFLAVSAKHGLLGDINRLSAAGDGTPVVTSVYPRSKPTCECRARGLADCNHPRLYTQPDCDSGWDSARERYFNGYHLYMMNASDSPYDLPLYPRLHPASRHDAISFVVTSIEFAQRFTLGTLDKILLDAAHDAEAIYRLINHQHQEPFIDLNKRGKTNIDLGNGMSLSPEGTPICPKGRKMKPNGFDKSRNRQKWRCSPICECSTAKYGRVFHTHNGENFRMFLRTPRETEAWKNIYKRRTSVERSNKREKIDYHLERGRHRSTMMWATRIYGIMMCQHIDAWYLHRKEELLHQRTIFFTQVA